MAVIEMRNIRKVYATGENTVEALKDVNLMVEKGDFTAIIGRSGSGKSTLMNILGCLDLPTSGQYLLNGEEVSTADANRLSVIRNRHIGFVFQSFHLLPTLTALENVEMPLLYAKMGRAERRERAQEMLCRVGLADRMHHYPKELSGGQQQRVAVARAVAGAPPLLLADEPTGNLDEASGRDIMRLLRELHEGGATVLLITHDPQIAKAADQCAEMQDGRLKFSKNN